MNGRSAGTLPHQLEGNCSACSPLINIITDAAMPAAFQSLIDTTANNIIRKSNVTANYGIRRGFFLLR
jgi:hypothetical protein